MSKNILSGSLTWDSLEEAVKGSRDFVLTVPLALRTVAHVICDHMTMETIDSEYDGDSDKYFKDIKKLKRSGITIIIDKDLDPDTFAIFQ